MVVRDKFNKKVTQLVPNFQVMGAAILENTTFVQNVLYSVCIFNFLSDFYDDFSKRFRVCGGLMQSKPMNSVQ